MHLLITLKFEEPFTAKLKVDCTVFTGNPIGAWNCSLYSQAMYMFMYMYVLHS